MELTQSQYIILFYGMSLVETEDCKIVSDQGLTRRMYAGSANISSAGPCLKWTEAGPEFVNMTGGGDHNYCRNPDISTDRQEICFTDNGSAPCDVQTCGKARQFILSYSVS